MRRNYRKVIGMLLTMSMILTMLPAGVFAAEQNSVSSPEITADDLMESEISVEDISEADTPDAIPDATADVTADATAEEAVDTSVVPDGTTDGFVYSMVVEYSQQTNYADNIKSATLYKDPLVVYGGDVTGVYNYLPSVSTTGDNVTATLAGQWYDSYLKDHQSDINTFFETNKEEALDVRDWNTEHAGDQASMRTDVHQDVTSWFPNKIAFKYTGGEDELPIRSVQMFIQEASNTVSGNIYSSTARERNNGSIYYIYASGVRFYFELGEGGSDPETPSGNKALSSNMVPVIIPGGVKVKFSNDSSSMETIPAGSDLIGKYEYYDLKENDRIIKGVDIDHEARLKFHITGEEGKHYRVKYLVSNDEYEDDPSEPQYVWEKQSPVDDPVTDSDGVAYEYDLTVHYGAVKIEEYETYEINFNAIDCSVINPDTESYEGVELTGVTVAQGERCSFRVNCPDDYMVESCGTDYGETIGISDEEDETLYSFVPTANTVVTVIAVPVDRIVHFYVDPSAGSLDPDSVSNSNVKPDEEDPNTYYVSYKADGIYFQVIPPTNQPDPEVWFENNDGVPEYLEMMNDEGWYKIPWSELPVETAVAVVRHEDVPPDMTVKITYPVNVNGEENYLKSVTLTDDETVYTPQGHPTVSGDTVTDTYKIPFGKAPKLQVIMNEGFNAGYIRINKSGQSVLYNGRNKDIVKRGIPVLGDVSIRLYPLEKIWVRVRKGGISGNIVSGTVKLSTVTYELGDGDYVGEVMLGSKKAESGQYVNPSITNTSDTFSNGIFKFHVDNSDKTAKSSRYYSITSKNYQYTWEGKTKTIQIKHDFRIKPTVRAVAGLTVKAAGLEDNGSCTLTADSRTVFKLNAKDSKNRTTSLDGVDLRAEYGGKSLTVPKKAEFDLKGDDNKTIATLTYDPSKKKLEMVTGAAEEDVTLKFTVDDKPLATVPISIKKEQSLSENAPDVNVTGTSDSQVFLQFKDTDIPKPYKGKTYYKVVATAKAGERPENMISGATWYIEREYPELLDYDDAETDARIAAIDKKNQKIREAFRQNATLDMIVDHDNPGAACDYDFKVSCVNTYPGVSLGLYGDDHASEKIFIAGKEAELNASTKDPSYPTKMTVSKKRTAFYAGENDVNVAVVNFNNDATCTYVTAGDISYSNHDDEVRVSYDPATRKLMLRSFITAAPGKHTIQLYAQHSDNMAPLSTTFTVTVYKPIESIDVTPQALEYVKAENKKLSFKVGVKLNAEGKKPKTAKVKYSIVPEEIPEGYDEDELPCPVTIKNGTVTVGKYTPSKTDEDEEEDKSCPDFSFRVMVTAADFAGNETFGVSEPVRISTERRLLGSPMLLVPNDNGTYSAIADGATESIGLTTHMLKKAFFVVTDEKDVRKQYYTDYDLHRFFVNPGLLTIKTSNKKALAIDTIDRNSGKAWFIPKKVAKNVVISATTKDGGRDKVTLKVNIVYDKPAELGLALGRDTTPSCNSITISGNGNTPFDVQVMKRDEADGDWTGLNGLTNSSLTIKGGKFVYKNPEYGFYSVCLTGEKATLTLKDKGNGTIKTYAIINGTYKDYKSNAVTAKAGNTLKSGTGKGQVLKINVSSKKYDLADKYLLLEPDIADYYQRGTNYFDFFWAIGVDDPMDGKAIKLTSAGNGKAVASVSLSGIAVNPCKLKLTAYCVEKKGDGYSLPLTKPVTVTVKFVKPKKVKGSFKPQTSYKISKTSVSSSVILSTSGKKVKEIWYNDCYNANVGGSENYFKTYFQYTPTDHYTDPENPVEASIRLRPDLTADQIAYITSPEGAADRTGYVTYYASLGDDGYGDALTVTEGITKVTISFK